MIKSRDGFIADYLVSVETPGQLNGTSGSKHEKTLGMKSQVFLSLDIQR